MYLLGKGGLNIGYNLICVQQETLTILRVQREREIAHYNCD